MSVLALGPQSPLLRVMLLVVLFLVLFPAVWVVTVKLLDRRRPGGAVCPECGLPREERWPKCARCLARSAPSGIDPAILDRDPHPPRLPDADPNPPRLPPLSR